VKSICCFETKHDDQAYDQNADRYGRRTLDRRKAYVARRCKNSWADVLLFVVSCGPTLVAATIRDDDLSTADAVAARPHARKMAQIDVVDLN
jgi:hypothetical protein